MNIKIIYFLCLLLHFLFIVGCNSKNTRNDTTNSLDLSDSISLIDTDNTAGSLNITINNQLKPIKDNFKRINSILNWTLVDEKEIRETTEGGYVSFFYNNDVVEKIAAHYFGETFQLITEYYLIKNNLSFAFEKLYKYNRPIYYTTITEDMDDTEVFDFEKSRITEIRSYFSNKKLIHQNKKGEDDLFFQNNSVNDEESRLLMDFEKLLKLCKEK